MRSFKLLSIALFQCQLYIAILADSPCTPDHPSLHLNSSHWTPTFCGDWRVENADHICVRVYCDQTSKSPLEPTVVRPVIGNALDSLAYEPDKDRFTDHTWAANDPTGRPGFILRIAEWEKRPKLLSNIEVIWALESLAKYWSGPPYEQSDFLIYYDGVGVIGGGSGRRPPRLGTGTVNTVLAS